MRSQPTANLQFCETHVLVRAKLTNGTTLRLGTATLSNVPEEDNNTYSYTAKLSRDSEVLMSTTQAANQMSVEAINVDKSLGLTINDINSSLEGAQILVSKVFANPQTMNMMDFSPKVWFDSQTIKDTLPERAFSEWPDSSGNNINAFGNAILEWRKLSGQNAVRFSSTEVMTIPGNFALAQIFLVFSSPNPTFISSGSIVGSPVPAFRFASGTTHFSNPLPVAVRDNGVNLLSPYTLSNLNNVHILNIKTNNPAAIRQYLINNQDNERLNFSLGELVGFTSTLSGQNEQFVENILANKYGVDLPYTLSRNWENKVLLVGQISEVNVDEGIVTLRIVSDTAPNVAFLANRPISSHCPLVFKGVRCGYTGPLTTCNKQYDSVDGCAGRQNQHRFGGIVMKGELPGPIIGDIDTTVGQGGRFSNGEHFPDGERNRIFRLV